MDETSNPVRSLEFASFPPKLISLFLPIFKAITICNMNSMQRSVLQKYGIEDSDAGIEVFDRMVNVGTESNVRDWRLISQRSVVCFAGKAAF